VALLFDLFLFPASYGLVAPDNRGRMPVRIPVYSRATPAQKLNDPDNNQK
jgi:hypothetical protein